MKTNISPDLLKTPQGQKANQILRSCVHCGFCSATCPTYGLLADELDSPRGRIYLIKQVVEGNPISKNSLLHLDRCLTCRACETTCPSGVEYAHLLDIGRELLEKKLQRKPLEQLIRFGLRKSLTNPLLINTATTLLPFLKHSKKQNYPSIKKQNNKKILLLSGCVQPALAPNINHATGHVLNRLGFDVIETPQKQCCGAIEQHLSAQDFALVQIKTNIDAWYQQLQTGVSQIISTASGCGVMVKDYAHLLADDSHYADKADYVVKHTQDIAEFLSQQDLRVFKQKTDKKVAFHSPCTLQHGQQITGVVEKLLNSVGYQLTRVDDAHLCCGSAGTYSILQKKLSQQLLSNKLDKLQQNQPDLIATANIGCLLHLQKGTKTQVKHWVELLLMG